MCVLAVSFIVYPRAGNFRTLLVLGGAYAAHTFIYIYTHILRISYDSNDLPPSHLLGVGATVFERVHDAGVSTKLDHPPLPHHFLKEEEREGRRGIGGVGGTSSVVRGLEGGASHDSNTVEEQGSSLRLHTTDTDSLTPTREEQAEEGDAIGGREYALARDHTRDRGLTSRVVGAAEQQERTGSSEVGEEMAGGKKVTIPPAWCGASGVIFGRGLWCEFYASSSLVVWSASFCVDVKTFIYSASW